MNNSRVKSIWVVVLMMMFLASCKLPVIMEKQANPKYPTAYENGSSDSTNSGQISWKVFFQDSNLVSLIDTALKNNQELNITLWEIQMAQNEVMARKGEYLPFLNYRAGAGVDKPARYTEQGALEATTEIEPGKEFPDPLPDFMGGVYATWEVDIWHKLRNARKSAYMEYLSSMDGRNFMITNLIAEIANSYYELLALDNQLQILQQNIQIQNNALKIVRLQKEATRVNELAVRRFEAQVYKTQSMQFDIHQQIIETENRINFLVGRYPQPVARPQNAFNLLTPDSISVGLPAQMLTNRPDIRQAEKLMQAAKLDVSVAKANFYPSLDLSAGIGLRAFNPSYLTSMPESMLYSLAGDVAGPLINRNAIKAMYMNANAHQIQSVFDYERTVLNAYIEVVNQMAKIGNLEKSYDLRSKQVDALNQSVSISNDLFKSARADYMEVLMTQRDALESRFELVETRKEQMNAMVNIYRALGGGWQ
ncbi:MAG: TolC family protein [Bacteroidetes bacterium]|nr:TolC family protein [Bacteroidota bacterium]